MTLTYHQVASHVRHTLGGELSSELDMYQIINQAGDFMCGMHPWRWLETEAAGLTPASDGIDLPTPFIELLHYAPRLADTRATGTRYALTSRQDVLDYQHSTAATETNVIYFCVSHSTVSGVPTPRLEFSGTSTEPITLWYRAGWEPVTTDSSTSDPFVLPAFCEPIYLQTVRAFARGYEEEDASTMNPRLAEIANGPTFFSAIQRDSLIEGTTLRTVRRTNPSGVPSYMGLQGQRQQGA